MKILTKEQLSELKQRIDQMLTLLEMYEISAKLGFQAVLQMISHNIEKCIKCDFDGIEELSRYIYEDWRTVCVGKNGIENHYLNIDDITLKCKVNKEFDALALSVEQLLGTNFLVPREWYSKEELVSVGETYVARKKYWQEMIERLRQSDNFYISPLEQVPDDIWSFAKMLCLAGSDDSLKEWFIKDVPAFGYLSPVKILQVENGEDILRNLMYDIPR